MSWEHVQPGERWQAPEAFEYNAMLDAGRRAIAAQGKDPSGLVLGGISPQASVLRVINKSGAMRRRYEGVELGGPRWAVAAKHNLQGMVMEAKAPGPEKVPAVLLQPLRVDGVGLAVVAGPTLLRMGTYAGAEAYADMDSTGKWVPAASGPVRYLGGASDGYGVGILAQPVASQAGLRIVSWKWVPNFSSDPTEYQTVGSLPPMPRFNVLEGDTGFAEIRASGAGRHYIQFLQGGLYRWRLAAQVRSRDGVLWGISGAPRMSHRIRIDWGLSETSPTAQYVQASREFYPSVPEHDAAGLWHEYHFLFKVDSGHQLTFRVAAHARLVADFLDEPRICVGGGEAELTRISDGAGLANLIYPWSNTVAVVAGESA